MTISPAEIRKRILRQRRVELKRHTRKPISVDQLPVPYKKSRLMQLVELQQGQRLEAFIFTGTIYDAEKKLGIDATTIHNWRVLITEARRKEFFKQFE